MMMVMVIMMLMMITLATTSLKRVNRKEEGGGGAAAVPVLSHIAWLVAAVGFAYFMNQVAPRGVCEMCDVFLIYMWMRTLSHQYTKQSTPSSCPLSSCWRILATRKAKVKIFCIFRFQRRDAGNLWPTIVLTRSFPWSDYQLRQQDPSRAGNGMEWGGREGGAATARQAANLLEIQIRFA